MAMVVWAAALEAMRPRRGAAGAAAAGRRRACCGPRRGCWPRCTGAGSRGRRAWRKRLAYAALAAIGPVLWAATDWAVTGDPLFSLHYTSSSAEDLGRQLPLSQLPSAIPEFFANLVKLPVLVAAVIGLGDRRCSPRRAGPPRRWRCSRPASSTFVLIGIAGASAIERYLAVAAVALLVFAGVDLRRLHACSSRGGCGRPGWSPSSRSWRVRRRVHRHPPQPHDASTPS